MLLQMASMLEMRFTREARLKPNPRLSDLVIILHMLDLFFYLFMGVFPVDQE